LQEIDVLVLQALGVFFVHAQLIAQNNHGQKLEAIVTHCHVLCLISFLDDIVNLFKDCLDLFDLVLIGFFTIFNLPIDQVPNKARHAHEIILLFLFFAILERFFLDFQRIPQNDIRHIKLSRLQPKKRHQQQLVIIHNLAVFFLCPENKVITVLHFFITFVN